CDSATALAGAARSGAPRSESPAARRAEPGARPRRDDSRPSPLRVRPLPWRAPLAGDGTIAVHPTPLPINQLPCRSDRLGAYWGFGGLTGRTDPDPRPQTRGPRIA